MLQTCELFFTFAHIKSSNDACAKVGILHETKYDFLFP